MPRFVNRHLPLITPRIRFHILRRPAQDMASIITARVNFGERSPLLADRISDHGREDTDVDSSSELPRPSTPDTQDISQASLISNSDAHMAVDAPMSDSEYSGEDIDGLSDHASEQVSQLDILIPKPSGEPGRPHCGGYNLKTQLVGWTPQLYDTIKVCLIRLASYGSVTFFRCS